MTPYDALHAGYQEAIMVVWPRTPSGTRSDPVNGYMDIGHGWAPLVTRLVKALDLISPDYEILWVGRSPAGRLNVVFTHCTDDHGELAFAAADLSECACWYCGASAATDSAVGNLPVCARHCRRPPTLARPRAR